MSKRHDPAEDEAREARSLLYGLAIIALALVILTFIWRM